jgi:hypothetical protein
MTNKTDAGNDSIDKINLAEKFALFSEHWRPKTITVLNGQEIKLIKGEPWRARAREQVQWTCENGERREPERVAGGRISLACSRK